LINFPTTGGYNFGYMVELLIGNGEWNEEGKAK
jgi:hypothetical protein